MVCRELWLCFVLAAYALDEVINSRPSITNGWPHWRLLPNLCCDLKAPIRRPEIHPSPPPQLPPSQKSVFVARKYQPHSRPRHVQQRFIRLRFDVVRLLEYIDCHSTAVGVFKNAPSPPPPLPPPSPSLLTYYIIIFSKTYFRPTLPRPHFLPSPLLLLSKYVLRINSVVMHVASPQLPESALRLLFYRAVAAQHASLPHLSSVGSERMGAGSTGACST